jgi:hypothetical protein
MEDCSIGDTEREDIIDSDLDTGRRIGLISSPLLAFVMRVR